jgi:hypothetical protein
MHHRFHRGPSPALIVACLALAIALSGTGYAAFTLPPGSVGAKQLKKGAVVNKKLAKGAVTSVKVKDNSLTGADVLESSLGKVPLAANADRATRASSADNAASASNAAHATSADSATSATNAAIAGNAGAVNGYAANSLVRVARMATTLFQPLTFGLTTYGAPLSITAPSHGFVLVTGSYTVGMSAPCTVGCVAAGLIRHTQDAALSNIVYASLAHYGDSQNMAFAHVFQVSAGLSVFELRTARALGGDGTLQAQSASLTALFVPFGSTGGGTLGPND